MGLFDQSSDLHWGRLPKSWLLTHLSCWWWQVTRQVAQCKCAKRFQVEQIGENKYRVRQRGMETPPQILLPIPTEGGGITQGVPSLAQGGEPGLRRRPRPLALVEWLGCVFPAPCLAPGRSLNWENIKVSLFWGRQPRGPVKRCIHWAGAALEVPLLDECTLCLCFS